MPTPKEAHQIQNHGIYTAVVTFGPCHLTVPVRRFFQRQHAPPVLKSGFGLTSALYNRRRAEIRDTVNVIYSCSPSV